MGSAVRLLCQQFEAVYLLPVYPELSNNNINHQPSATMMLGKTVTMSMLCWGCLLLILVFGVHHSTAGPGHYIHDYYKNQLTEENSRNARNVRNGGLSLTPCSTITMVQLLSVMGLTGVLMWPSSSCSKYKQVFGRTQNRRTDTSLNL